jgi:NitT/TauT family transport system substrate-binding protein
LATAQLMPWKRRVAIALTASLLAVSAARAETPTSSKLDIPYQAISIGQVPLWTALDGGFFRRYGIDASGEFAAQSPALVASMLSGETPIANLGQDAVISADLNGADLEILVSGPEKLFFTLYARPSLHTVADLKGKKIGVTRFGTTTDFIARYILKRAGLDPQRDAVLLPIGSQWDRLAALASGAADAAVLGPPITITAGKQGFNAVANMLDYDLLYYTDALVAKKSWVAAHRTETLNVVRGFVAGIAAVRTDKKAAIAAFAKYTKTDDPEVLEASYDLLVKALPRIPVPKRAAVQTGLDANTLAAAKNADPASFIDPSFVKELDKDGFIANLYQ